uniref:(California timema) hypothetical protein n=1 Tax=Timema californicum TaxID=61474 RepID=A0A7R9J676_TIMCA|nr:unnamed protein product [Timema californicum]
MFIDRPRLHFNGCYICKTTYIRHGENSFQDQFYRPWHLVEYYRYLRLLRPIRQPLVRNLSLNSDGTTRVVLINIATYAQLESDLLGGLWSSLLVEYRVLSLPEFFPEGVVLMLTTPDDPMTSLAHLRQRTPRNPAVLTGHYRLHEDRVIMVLKKHGTQGKISGNNRYRARHNRATSSDLEEQNYHLELQINSYRNRLHTQLAWQGYSIFMKLRNGAESTSKFELPTNRYPPFWFSRVKSYTAESENPLQLQMAGRSRLESRLGVIRVVFPKFPLSFHPNADFLKEEEISRQHEGGGFSEEESSQKDVEISPNALEDDEPFHGLEVNDDSMLDIGE